MSNLLPPSFVDRQEILLVTTDSTAIQLALEEQGLRVLAVEDCFGALQVIKGHPFDAVVVAMDCSDRNQFLERLRETDAAVQVILCSDTAKLEELSTQFGFEILARSASISTLRLAICRAVELTRLRRENVRLRKQLSVVVPGAVLRADGAGSEVGAPPVPLVGSNADLASINRAHVTAVLAQHGGNKAQTARALGINRRSLYRLLDKYAH